MSERTHRTDDIDRLARSELVHPKHYSNLAIEPIDFIRASELNFNLGSVVKYVARAGRKECAITDLLKARDCIDHELTRLLGTEIGRKVLALYAAPPDHAP